MRWERLQTRCVVLYCTIFFSFQYHHSLPGHICFVFTKNRCRKKTNKVNISTPWRLLKIENFRENSGDDNGNPWMRLTWLRVALFFSHSFTEFCFLFRFLRLSSPSSRKHAIIIGAIALEDMSYNSFVYMQLVTILWTNFNQVHTWIMQLPNTTLHNDLLHNLLIKFCNCRKENGIPI